MAVRSSRTFARVLGVLGVLALAQGCTDDGVSMHVICPIAPTISGTTCTWDPAAGLCVVEGVLNVLGAETYALELKVESGLKPRARDVPPQAEPNGLQVTTAKIELRTTNGDIIGFPTLANPYEVPVAGYIPPANAEMISVSALTADYVSGLWSGDPTIAKSVKTIADEIVIALKLKGTTNGSVTVESGEFLWPVRLIVVEPLKGAGCLNGMFCSSIYGQDDSANVCIDSTTTGS